MTEKQKRGFALLSPERRAQIASKGGKSVPNEKRYFATNREAASRCSLIGVSKRKRAKTA